MHSTLLLFLGALSSPELSSTPPAITVQTDEARPREALELHDHKDLQVAVQRLANEFPELITVLPIGNSRGGRKIDAVRVAAGMGNPSILVVANLDGPLAYTSSIVLEEARALSAAYGTDERVTQLLDSTTFYFVPRANPDAAEARFKNPLMEVEASGHAIDNDRDGRMGEDSPSDVNGDGFVSWMRVPAPEGEWVSDTTDARILVKADAAFGEQGKWKLMREAGDPDGDEQAGEDPEFDAIVNRNFPARWKEHTAEGGLYATDEPESRALIEFVMAHKDISLVVTYGEQDNLVEAPKGIDDDAKATLRVPKKGVYESDAKLLSQLSKEHARITESKARGNSEDHGSFQLWCYEHRGLLTLNSSIWSPSLDSPKEEEKEEGDEEESDEQRKPSDNAKLLASLEALEEDFQRFIEWKSFEHPTLGTVEIGGFAPYARIEPPTEMLAELAAKEGEFLVELGDWLPRLEIAECTFEDLGGGLLRVDATVVNNSRLPLVSRSAERNRAFTSVEVTLSTPRGAQFLGGKQREFLRELAPLGGRAEYSWLVTNVNGPIQLSVRSTHAGNATATPTEVK